MLGKKLRGRYKIIQKLGSGAFGDTYLALDEDLPRTPKRVVKHLKPKDLNPAVLPVARQLFKQEAEALYHLKHEQIPQLFAHFEEDGEFYLVEDYVDGQDLSRAEVIPGKKLSEAEVISLLQGILEVLVYVHQEKVIHLDIKPQNLIKRTQDGKIVLIDFGAVKEINTLVINAQGQTIASVVVGTPGYMPSEQASGHPQPCSDIYAVGMIGIQALTGIRPDQLPKDPNTLEAIWRNQAHVSPKLANILDKMVRYHPRQRYQSASEVLQALPGLKPQRNWRQIAVFMALFGGLIAGVVGIMGQFIPEIRKICCQPPVELAEYSWTSENSDYRITMKYPKNWRIQPGAYPYAPDVDILESPQESDSDTFREQVIINVVDLEKPLLLNEYTNALVNGIKEHLTDFKLLDQCENEITLAAGKTNTVCYMGKEEGHNLRYLLAVTLNGNRAYYVTYIAETDKYGNFLEPVKDMVESFKIVEGG